MVPLSIVSLVRAVVFTVYLFHFTAKYNAETHYAVVGAQDDIETSLCVLQAYVPLFFKRALKIYKNMGIVQFMQYENSHSATQRKLKGDVNSFYNVKARTLEKGEVRKTLKFMKNETPHKQNISQLFDF